MTETSLGELSMDGGRYGIAASAVDYTPDLPAYLRITDIRDDGTLDLSSRKSVEDPNATDYMLEPNDIVFARTGNSTGRNYFYDPRDGRFAYAGFLIKFSLNPAEVNPRYIKYYAQSKPYWDWVASFNTGSTRGNINAKTYASMPITLPSRCTQDGIVRFCDAISDKIRVNGQINGYLAAMCDTVFSEQFGSIEDNAVLSDIADITMGQSPSGKSYNEDGDGTVFYQGRGEFGWRFPSQRLFTTEPKRMAKEGDVLMSVRAPVGDLNVAYEGCCIGRGLAAIHSQYPSYCLYLMRSLGKKLDAYNGEGTVFGSINGKALNGLEIGLPDVDAIKAFEAFAHPVDLQIRANVTEERCLETLRDTLLPKLMSGEIDVSQIELPTPPNSHLCARRLKASRV
jgi:type I restriction enzyme S subunit